MKIRSLLPVTAAVLAAGVMVLPSAAMAAPADTANLAVLIERHPDGKPVIYPIHPGETVPVVAGVVNQGDQAVSGVAVRLRIVDDLDLPKKFGNCQYFVDQNLHGAWCQIDAELAPAGKYALAPLDVSAAKDAKKAPGALVVQFVSKKWADDQGGIAALAKSESGAGTTPVAGTGGPVGLVKVSDLPLPKDPASTGSVGFDLRLPSASASPTTGTASPTRTASSSASSSAAVAGTAGSDGGGLPLTGSKSAAVAGLGAVLLVGGAGVFLLTRRRRAKFVA